MSCINFTEAMFNMNNCNWFYNHYPDLLIRGVVVILVVAGTIWLCSQTNTGEKK